MLREPAVGRVVWWKWASVHSTGASAASRGVFKASPVASLAHLGALKGPRKLAVRRTDGRTLARGAVAHFLKCLNWHEEGMLQKERAEGAFNILCCSIILDVEPSVCSHIRRTET